MRIIKEGALAGDAVYQTTCISCGTEYEFQRKEARFTSDQREGDALVTTCPMDGCDRQNWTSVRAKAGSSQWNR